MAHWQGKDTTIADQGAGGTTPPAGRMDEGNYEKCVQKCEDRYERMLADANISDERANNMYERCLRVCKERWGTPIDEPLPPGPTQNCYKPKSVGGIPMEACREGYSIVEKNGEKLCCEDRSPEPPEPPGPDDGELCAGGYVLGNDFAGGTGSGSAFWDDPYGILPANRFQRSGDWEGHDVWDTQTKKYYKVEDLQAHFSEGAAFPQGYDSVCRKGFKRSIVGGQVHCCPETGGGGGGETGQGLGAFDYPDWLKDLMGQLSGRAGELLDPSQYGYSQTSKDYMFGKNFENIREQEGGLREQLTRELGSQGKLGTGEEMGQMRDLAWDTERRRGDLMRDVFVKDEEQRKQDMLSHTELARQIFGGGLTYEQIRELINSGRRGEEADALNQLLNFLGTIMWR